MLASKACLVQGSHGWWCYAASELLFLNTLAMIICGSFACSLASRRVLVNRARMQDRPNASAEHSDTLLWCACRYRLIGLIKTLCGVLVPAIVSTLSTFEAGSQERGALMLTSILVSVLGTISTALEDFYQYVAVCFFYCSQNFLFPFCSASNLCDLVLELACFILSSQSAT